VVALAVIVAVLIISKMRPVNMHLSIQRDKTPLQHLWHTIRKRNYRIGFTATALLSIGGFMMMPFGSAFAVNNLQVPAERLSILFFVAGIASFITMPLIGKLSDRVDKYKLFVAASIYMAIIVIIYTNLGPRPLWFVIMFNIIMMTGIFGRIVPATVLVSAIPEMQDRGAFMSINSSLQQIAGGIAASVGGIIVIQKTSTSPLEHYNTLGLVVVSISAIAVLLMLRVDRMIKSRKNKQPSPPVEELIPA
jgi:predicted MFS family arabinose efflux permease